MCGSARGHYGSKLAAERAVNAVIEGIQSGLRADEKVQLIGFGSFTVKKLGARVGRNPQTGSTIRIPPSKTVTFRPGKGLKTALQDRPWELPEQHRHEAYELQSDLSVSEMRDRVAGRIKLWKWRLLHSDYWGPTLTSGFFEDYPNGEDDPACRWDSTRHLFKLKLAEDPEQPGTFILDAVYKWKEAGDRATGEEAFRKIENDILPLLALSNSVKESIGIR